MALFWSKNEARPGAILRLLIPQIAFWTGFLTLNAIAPNLPVVRQASGVGRYLVEIGFYGTVLFWALIFFGLSSRWLDGGRLADRGLDLSARWFSQFGAGLVLGALVVSCIFVIQLALGWIVVIEGWRPFVLGVPLAFGLASAAMKALIVASWEELVFRAGLIPGLADLFEALRAPRAIAVGAALVLPGLVFGFAHLANENATLTAALAISVAGMFTGVIYVRTGSLALPIGAHAAWNFFQAHIYGFPLSGQTVSKTSVLVIEQHGPSLWTGGEAGPEAGLLCLIAILIAAAVVIGLTKPQPFNTASHRKA